MPQDSKPTQPIDLLTKWTALALGIVMTIPIVIGRMHPRPAVAIAATLATLTGAWPVDRVEGKRRAILGTTTWLLTYYAVIVAWPWTHWWYLIPVALAPYGVVVIGAGRGSPKRVEARVKSALPPALVKALPADVTPAEPVVANGKVTIKLTAGTGTPKGAMAELERRATTALKLKRGDVKLNDLGRTIREGVYELVITDQRPFDFPPPTKPAEWPVGSFPLGWNAEGDVVWVSSGLHGIVAGETGSGKSNTLNVIIEAANRHDRALILVDPKQTELYPWRHHAAAYADQPAEILAALRQAEKLSAERRQWLRDNGRKEWRATDGPMVTIVIDEMSELARICPEAMPLCESLARLSRSAGFQCWFADQYPTAAVFPQVVKQNTPIVIGHRVKNGVAERVVLGEDATKEGWCISDGKLPVGRAVVELPGMGRQWVQVFPEEGVPELPSTVSTPPTSSPPLQDEYPELDTGHWTVDTPELDTPKPKRYKHDDAIENALTGLPRSARDIADEVGCSPTTATQALARIAARGRAKAVGDGWVCPYLHELAT